MGAILLGEVLMLPHLIQTPTILAQFVSDELRREPFGFMEPFTTRQRVADFHGDSLSITLTVGAIPSMPSVAIFGNTLLRNYHLRHNEREVDAWLVRMYEISLWALASFAVLCTTMKDGFIGCGHFSAYLSSGTSRLIISKP